MRLLIVGGSGYLGKSLRLAAEQVGISTIFTSLNGEGIRLDIRDAENCQKVLAKVDPDIILCLAASGVSPKDRHRADFDPQTNSLGPTNLFRSANSPTRATKNILISTAKELPANANQTTDRYIQSKQDGVQNLRSTGCAFLDVRLNNTYGPNQPNDRFVKWLTRELIEGREPEIHNPNLECDFVYESDVTQALLQILERDLDSTQTIEIGTGIRTSLESIKETVSSILEDRGRANEFLHPVRNSNAIRIEREGTNLLKMICPTGISTGLNETIWSMT